MRMICSPARLWTRSSCATTTPRRSWAAWWSTRLRSRRWAMTLAKSSRGIGDKGCGTCPCHWSGEFRATSGSFWCDSVEVIYFSVRKVDSVRTSKEQQHDLMTCPSIFKTFYQEMAWSDIPWSDPRWLDPRPLMYNAAENAEVRGSWKFLFT